MAGSAAAHRHTDLEDAMAELARAQSRTHAGLQRLEKNLDRLATEMREGQAETRANLDRYIAENERRFIHLALEVEKTNKAAGDAVNRAGRLVEDIVAPSIRDFFRQTFAWTGPVSSGIRVWRAHADDPDAEQEFDAFAAGGDVFVLFSVKSRVSPDGINQLLETLASVRRFFPEAEDRKAYGAIASLYVEPSVIKTGERRGLFMIGLQSGLIRVLNSPDFKPSPF